MTMFEGLAPVLLLVVQSGAAPGSDCTAAAPCPTIQAAVQRAEPGSAILVGPGTYAEAIKFPSRTGAGDRAPIWLISAEGPERTRIVVPDQARAGIQGLGVSNVAVVGLTVEGGINGIQFSLSGDPSRDPTVWQDADRYPRRILVQGNSVRGQKEDAIKLSQAAEVAVVDNTTADVGDQCIDFVAVNRSRISWNECSGARHAAGIFAKAGSNEIEISHNTVHDIAVRNVHGIALGGEANKAFFRPDQRDYEAAHLAVHDNRVERIAGYPIIVQGAQESKVRANLLEPTPTSPGIVGVAHGSPGLWPRAITIEGNAASGPKKGILLDRRTRADGQPNIDAKRDAITIERNDGQDFTAQTGPRSLTLWSRGPLVSLNDVARALKELPGN